MVHLPKMADLMDYNIVSQLCWQEKDAIIEIEDAALGTAAPLGTVVFDADGADRKLITPVQYFHAFTREAFGARFAGGVGGLGDARCIERPGFVPVKMDFAQNPLRARSNELFNMMVGNGTRGDKSHRRVGSHHHAPAPAPSAADDGVGNCLSF